MGENIIEVKNISKKYPGVMALKGISFDIKKNTVHCIVGENGAGKSTFIKIMTGAITKSGGTILYNGQDYQPKSIKDAMKAGMSVLYQELNVVDDLTVKENLTLGIEESKGGILQYREQSEKLFRVLNKFAPEIDLNSKVEELSVGKKQILEIAKAVALETDLIIMDEPTAAISEKEVEHLMELIRSLREHNVTVIYISHRLSEIMELGDYVTVFRDGEVIGTKAVRELSSQSELIKMMIGKVVSQEYIPNENIEPQVVLSAKGITNKKLQDISFDLHEGEILGFYGLVGAGKTEICKALYGVDKYKGDLWVEGNKIEKKSIISRIKAGLALVPEERRTEGLFTQLSIKENIPYMCIKEISKGGILQNKKETELAREYIKRMRIAAFSENQNVANLSGGNQQKVVLAKCIASGCSVLILDEPTRGVDVGAKEEIYTLIRKITKEERVSVMVMSSELPEILGICDRIILLYEGKIVAEMKNGADIDSREIMSAVTGGGN